MPSAVLPDLPQAGLTLAELELYHLISDFRASHGAPPLTLSAGLTATAGYHAYDTLYNIWHAGLVMPPGTNLNSWSDAFYYGDHRDPSVMWNAPNRLGISYSSPAFEMTAAGFASVQGVFDAWSHSESHSNVLLNKGDWETVPFTSIGIGVAQDPTVDPYQGRIYYVWLGQAVDIYGPAEIVGSGVGDQIRATRSDDVLSGLGGNDDIHVGLGDDSADGGAGDDTMRGGSGHDTLLGGDDHDHLLGQRHGDLLNGGAGNDHLRGGGGNDTLIGGSGNDYINGGGRADYLEGGNGNDTLIGRNFSDTLIGGAGRDTLYGGVGADVLEGRSGDDWMKGGAEADDFVFDVRYTTGNDVIVDFDPLEDTLSLPGLDPDTLTASAQEAHLLLAWNKGSVLVRNVDLDSFDPLTFIDFGPLDP